MSRLETNRGRAAVSRAAACPRTTRKPLPCKRKAEISTGAKRVSNHNVARRLWGPGEPGLQARIALSLWPSHGADLGGTVTERWVTSGADELESPTRVENLPGERMFAPALPERPPADTSESP